MHWDNKVTLWWVYRSWLWFPAKVSITQKEFAGFTLGLRMQTRSIWSTTEDLSSTKAGVPGDGVIRSSRKP